MIGGYFKATVLYLHESSVYRTYGKRKWILHSLIQTGHMNNNFNGGYLRQNQMVSFVRSFSSPISGCVMTCANCCNLVARIWNTGNWIWVKFWVKNSCYPGVINIGYHWTITCILTLRHTSWAELLGIHIKVKQNTVDIYGIVEFILTVDIKCFSGIDFWYTFA